MRHIDPTCSLCRKDEETQDHLMIHCPFVKEVWRCTPQCPNPLLWHASLVDWIADYQNWHCQQGNNLDNLSKVLLCWKVWETRNQWIFKQIKPHPAKVLRAAAQVGRDFWEANATSCTINNSTNQQRIRCKPPEASDVKLNFDGSVKKNAIAAAGFIIRDTYGAPLISGAKKLGLNGVLQAEGLALFSGLQAAILAGHKRIHIEGDSKLLIDCIKGTCATSWRAKTIVENIVTLLQKFDFMKINHVYREANSVADALANLGHEEEDSRIWFNKLPSRASYALTLDQLGLGCGRQFPKKLTKAFSQCVSKLVS